MIRHWKVWHHLLDYLSGTSPVIVKMTQNAGHVGMLFIVVKSSDA